MNNNKAKPIILIVDDDPIGIHLIIRYLNELNYEIHVAASGEEAIDYLEEHIPDLIILDILMPGIDGYETCKRIKSIEKIKDIPVIFLTALNDSEKIVKGFSVGGADYLVKPCHQKEVIARVNAHINLNNYINGLKNTELNLKNEIISHKHTELLLRKNEQKYRLLLEEAVDSIILINPKTHNIVDFNKMAYKILGYTKEEFKKFTLHDIEYFENLETINLHLKKTIINKTYSYETKLKTKQNLVKYMHVRSMLISLNDEIYCQYIYRDITDLKQTLVQLSQISNLTAMGEMAATIAHELSYPLSIIRLLAENINQNLIINEPKSSFFKEVYEIINQVDRFKIIIDNIRSFAILNYNEIKPVYIYESINKALFFFKERFRINKIDLVLSIDNNIKINASDVQIEQLLVNFLTNSFYSVNEKEKTILNYQKQIFVRLYHDTKIHKAVIEIEDNGIGIPIEHFNYLSHPLKLSNNSSSTIEPDISIINSIINNFNLKIEARSSENKGTIIRIISPLIKDTPKKNQINKKIKLTDDFKKTEFEKQNYEILESIDFFKILIVDDELRQANILKKLLSHDGYKVYISINGHNALETFYKIHPQIVLLDIRIPEIDGIDLLKKIQNSFIDTEVIILTGHGDIKTAVKTIKQGAYGYLLKPVNYFTLKNEIKNALRRYHVKKKILLIDDDEIFRKRVEKILSLDNYEIHLAENAAEGFEILNNQSIDIVLLDLKLPDCDGMNVLKQIKNKYRYIEIIIITGYGQISFAVKAMTEGAFSYIQKPVEYDELIINIKNAYNKIRQKSQLLKDTLEKQSYNVHREKLTALGELAASVAHELKQPLNAINIIVQMMIKDIENNYFDMEGLHQDFIDIKGQIDRISEIIDHMRIFTRPAKNLNNIINVNDVVNSTLKFFSAQLKGHNILLNKELFIEIPLIKGDPHQLEQVLINFISNARHAVETSGKKDMIIDIKTFHAPANRSKLKKDSVVIQIKDNGNGVPEEYVYRIYEPFFTTKDPGLGTGLGIPISNKIIQEHKGAINLDNKVGKGAIFNIFLPVET